MTSKERMLVAMRGGKGDRVPVCPDISNMIPCRLTGKTFEQIYLYENPPLGDAYVEAVKYFGFDGWYWYWQPKITWKSRHGVELQATHETRPLPEGRYEQVSTYRTALGDLSQRMVYYPADPPTLVRKIIKDIARDLPIVLKWQDADIAEIDWTGGKENYDRFGDLGIWGLTFSCPPGPHMWFEWFDGGLEAVVGALYDYPDMMEELRRIQHRRMIELARAYLSAPFHIDYIMLGASGLLTMSSPDLFRKLSLPAVQEVTRLCKEAGVPTMLHACGKSRLLVEAFTAKTDLSCFNPLERPPMGDIELKNAKKIARGKLALMGNLHTTDVMLRGSAADVVRASKQAIDDAGVGGGFILSTGDQCGRDTPDENIRAMIRTACEYGRY